MKRIVSIIALVAAFGAAAPAQAASFQFNFGSGFFDDDPDSDFGDEFGILCKTERQLRSVLENRGYNHVLMGVINDDYHRVIAKATKNGVTYCVLLNSCTGTIITRERA